MDAMAQNKTFAIFTAGVLLTLLLGSIVWASLESNVLVGFGQLMDTRWGVATLVDIYIALTFIGIWMGVMENSLAKGMVLTLALYLLGNIVTLIYFVYRVIRCRSLKEVFTPEKGT